MPRGAAVQQAFSVDLGPGPNPAHPEKRKPFGLICATCAQFCANPAAVEICRPATGSHFAFRCQAAELRLEDRGA
eukprot:1916807-Prorocentrum_lima.AAC.1